MNKKHFVSNIEDTKKDILKLDKNKASQRSNIPIKIIKENLVIFGDFLCTIINNSFKSFNSLFPLCLKMTNVTLLHKKGKKDLKESCRPVSIFPIFSEVFERSIFTQMSSFFIFFSQNNNVASGKATVHNNVFWHCQKNGNEPLTAVKCLLFY